MGDSSGLGKNKIILHSINIGSIGSFFGGSFALIQASPMISIIGLGWLLKRLLTERKLPLSRVIFCFWVIALAWLALLTAANGFFDEIISVSGFVRQLASLLIGLVTFWFLICYLDDGRSALLYILRSFLYFFPVVMIAWYFGDDQRLSGFFHEPSHFAQFVSLIVAPAIFLVRAVRLRFFSISIVLFCLVLTSSATGIFQVALLLFFEVFQRIISARVVSLNRLLGFLFLLGASVYFFIDKLTAVSSLNYVQSNFSLIFSSEAFNSGLERSHSLADRFYSFYLPVINLTEARGWIGYGIGSDFAMYREFLMGRPGEHFWYGTTSGISSFWGKLLVTVGAPMTLLFLLIVAVLLWRTPRDLRPGALVTVIAGFYSMGAFSNVFIWFWLAVMFNCRVSGQIPKDRLVVMHS